jgi:hypothetical protein
VYQFSKCHHEDLKYCNTQVGFQTPIQTHSSSFKRSHHSKLALHLIFISSAFFLSLWILYYSLPSRIAIINPIPFSPLAIIPPEVWAERAEKVKDAFLHAWAGYESLAVPHYELLPVSNRTFDG